MLIGPTILVKSLFILLKSNLQQTPKPGVKGISQAVANHIEGKNHQHNGQTGCEGKHGITPQILIAIVDHSSPGGTWRLDTNADETKASLGQDKTTQLHCH
jgi:ABC-type nickel/cobalt efflux system permease component RcnA